jgi:UDP-glucose 4-epimerase
MAHNAQNLNTVFGMNYMLEHLNAQSTAPSRVVIMGAGGFVGGASADLFENDGVEVLRLGRSNMDLLSGDADKALGAELRAEDVLVVVSAQAPVKDIPMLMNNLTMMTAICSAIEANPVRHIVYISSDAIYGDSPQPLTEDSCAQPESLHGVMHYTREVMLQTAAGKTPTAMLRPTLIYGSKDPHNGYGPNRFHRQAADGKEIVLFGEGEERRDHVFIDDVAAIVRLAVLHHSVGALNVATGVVTSFCEIAKQVNALFSTPVEIKGSPRVGPMPHDGYRPFDIAACNKAFPQFNFTSLAEGLATVHTESGKV